MSELYENLIIGQQYYFHFQNYFITGFILSRKGNVLNIRNGHFSYPHETFPYDEATINLENVCSYATP